jgi:hypothetical protein
VEGAPARAGGLRVSRRARRVSGRHRRGAPDARGVALQVTDRVWGVLGDSAARGCLGALTIAGVERRGDWVGDTTIGVESLAHLHELVAALGTTMRGNAGEALVAIATDAGPTGPAEFLHVVIASGTALGTAEGVIAAVTIGRAAFDENEGPGARARGPLN